MTNITDRLKAMQDDWAQYQTMEDEVGFQPLPEGNYNVEVVDARLVESSNGKIMVHWDLVVLDGEYQGRHLFKNSVVDNASKDNMKWLTHDLHVLGLNVPLIHTLGTHLKKALGLKLRARQGNRSVFFNAVESEQ